MKGIVEEATKLGVYGQALIKKRGRYWPKRVPGDAINKHFATKRLVPPRLGKWSLKVRQ